MLLLVMADNLVLMYLGWEGVGLCSYLLIGFWFEVPSNCRAANKAFLITRIGDTALLIGLFLLFKELGTLNISGILHQAPDHFATGSSNIVLITIIIIGRGHGQIGANAVANLVTRCHGWSVAGKCTDHMPLPWLLPAYTLLPACMCCFSYRQQP